MNGRELSSKAERLITYLTCTFRHCSPLWAKNKPISISTQANVIRKSQLHVESFKSNILSSVYFQLTLIYCSYVFHGRTVSKL